MASIKLHVYRMDSGDQGETSVDYSGSGELGAGPEDQHRTVAEVDPADDALVAFVLENAPAFNKVANAISRAAPPFVRNLAGLLGLRGDGPVSIRVGVWDQ